MEAKRISIWGSFIKGAYFPYCYWCRHDGRCRLRHCRFLGMGSAEGIDKTPYPGHEDLSWHLSGFQQKSSRGMCTGRIYKTDLFYYPLMCQCGTAISSLTFSFLFDLELCNKFLPTKQGEKGLSRFQEVFEKDIIEEEFDPLDTLKQIIWEDNPDYRAVMMA